MGSAAFSRAQAASPNETICMLANVSLIGSTRYAAPEIVKAAGLTLNQGITVSALKEASDRLAATGAFAQLNYRYVTRNNTMTVTFTVEDAPAPAPCAFDNLVWLSREEIMQTLRDRVPLFDGNVYPNGKMPEVISEVLRSMLEARGIYAKVQAMPGEMRGGSARRMTFQAVGVPIPVAKVEFQGVQKVDEALLQQAAQPLLSMNYGTGLIGDFSRGTLSAVYRKRGYLRAAFGEPIPRLLSASSTPNSVAVTIPVTEGDQYRLSEIAWSGESVIPYTDLVKLLHHTLGSPVNAVQLDQDLFAVAAEFRTKGYLMAEAKGDAIFDDSAHSAIYSVQILQGDLYRLGKLEISGLDAALAQTLVQRSRLKPGDPYDRTYWPIFQRENIDLLPRTTPAWRLQPHETIHQDTKTVDVLLTFSPALSRTRPAPE